MPLNNKYRNLHTNLTQSHNKEMLQKKSRQLDVVIATKKRETWRKIAVKILLYIEVIQWSSLQANLFDF